MVNGFIPLVIKIGVMMHVVHIHDYDISKNQEEIHAREQT
jgi:hypothetical protein